MTNRETMKAWVDGKKRGRNAKGTVFFEGDVIYSYGPHYPLAVRAPGKSGPFFYVNKDKYSVTTSRHQTELLSAIASVPSCSILFVSIDYLQDVISRSSWMLTA